jgi:uroporphyrinogen decarboxylase
MNSKERVKRAFHFDKPDRVPLECVSPIKYILRQSDFFTVLQFEPRSWQPKNYPPHVMGGDTTLAFPPIRWIVYTWNKKYRKKTIYPKKWWEIPHKSIDEWGVIWQSSGTKSKDKTLGHPLKGPFDESWDNLDDYKIPDANDETRYRFAKTGIWRIVAKNRYILGSIGVDGIFHRCCHLRGFNNFLIDMVKNPKQVHKLIEKILPFYLIQAEKYKESYPALDSIMIADDLGTQKSPFLSPRLFKKFITPAYKQLIDLTHELGMDFILHSCGEIYDLIHPLIDIGVDVLEFDSPHMTGVENFKHYAEERKIAFWLSSNIQTTWTQGTPEEVDDEVKYYIKEVGNNEGGLALFEYPQYWALNTPKENVKAQRNAAKKWGNYNDQGVIEWLA